MNVSLRFEEYALNGWPAPQTLFYDGWVLRFASGYTRRANSVNPLYPSSLPLDEKIATCERLYADQGLPTIFKLTSQSQPAGLEEALTERGYLMEAPTVVQTLSLAGSGSFPIPNGFVGSEHLTEKWFSTYAALSGTDEKYLPAMRQVLSLIALPHHFAMIMEGELPVACGLLVRQGEFVGFYDVVVAREARRRGYGRRLMQGLLGMGQLGGARTAYLQVMLNNPAALALYANLGFREQYRYWYRVAG